MILRAELDELASRRGAELHYVIGDHAASELLVAEHLQQLVPDIAARDVYVCGPPAMTEATRASLDRSGVSRRHISRSGSRSDAARRRRPARDRRRGRAARRLRHASRRARSTRTRRSSPRPNARRRSCRRARAPRVGPATITPFSVIQVQATRPAREA